VEARHILFEDMNARFSIRVPRKSPFGRGRPFGPLKQSPSRPGFTPAASASDVLSRRQRNFQRVELFLSPHVALLTRHLQPPTAKWTLPTQHRASALSFVPARHASSLLRLAARPWLHIFRAGFVGFCRSPDAAASGSDRSRRALAETGPEYRPCADELPRDFTDEADFHTVVCPAGDHISYDGSEDSFALALAAFFGVLMPRHSPEEAIRPAVSTP
jgi:hypothetical protein